MKKIHDERMMKWFQFEHLRDEDMRSTSMLFCGLARCIITTIAPGPERTVALRKLLESKDAAVRAVLEGKDADNNN